MQIREATRVDAEALLTLFEAVYGQTTYLLMEPGESTQSAESLAERIDAGAKNDSEVWLVCAVDVEPIGFIYGRRGSARRNRHSLYVVMAVLQDFWGRGAGRDLLGAMELRAIERGIHRLELTVNALNQRAISLYERLAFEREGVKRRSLRIDGRYVDEIYMAKLVGRRSPVPLGSDPQFP